MGAILGALLVVYLRKVAVDAALLLLAVTFLVAEGAPTVVQRYAGFGLLPQAGLAQALALLFNRVFPEFSEQAGALVLSVVAINVLISPVAYRLALTRSGEVGKDITRSHWPERLSPSAADAPER